MQTAQSILNNISYPEDIKNLSVGQLKLLCDEIRSLIIDVMSETPGHFGASLGAVELSVVIHHVFDTPFDKLVWDVGHQAYAHKILTGRKEQFKNIRKKGGISGFPKMEESEFDAFGVGHSSTSISAVMGLAIASKLKAENRQHIAVIGDGALTGGLAFEGLNNLKGLDANILIIVNVNGMSIDPNVGGIEEHLNEIGIDNNLFTNLGILFDGIVDGNDVNALHMALQPQKEKQGVRILLCKTTKGKGFLSSEYGDATVWHAPGKFDKITGEIIQSNTGFPRKYQDVFGETLVELAKGNEDIVAVTPAMSTGSSLNLFKEYFPHRFFDVGIAEQHAVTFSAGLAAGGKLPFCVIYSTFLQRGYDQLIHDVALQNLPVVFCVDRAGLVGADGATHQGMFDIAFLRCIPNLTILAPMHEQELADMLYTIPQKIKGPIAIRYPRGKGVMENGLRAPKLIEWGKSSVLQKGKDAAILSVGPVGNDVKKVISKLVGTSIVPTHVNLKFIKPLDEELLHHIFQNFSTIVTLEEGTIVGGMGSAILEFKEKHNYQTKVEVIGLPDAFIEQGSKDELYDDLGLSVNSIVSRIEQLFENNKGN